MSYEGNYQLEILVNSPKKVVEEDVYKINYTIKNLSETTFPGGTINIEMYWASIGSFMLNNHVMDVKELAPGETDEKSFDQKAQISGLTVLKRPQKDFLLPHENGDQGAIALKLPNGNVIPYNQIIHSIKVQRNEEITEQRNLTITAVSLVLLIFMQILDWILQYGCLR